MTSSSAGPLTLVLVIAVAAAIAVLVGWLTGRGGQRRGLGIGALVFVILGAGGLWLAKARPVAETAPAPVVTPTASPTPYIASTKAGGKHEAVRKAPSVAAQDIMMLWTVAPADRERVCTNDMKHFAQDCRDAAAGMVEMSRPAIPDKLFADLGKAVKGDLINRNTSDLADQAIAATRATQPDEMYAFPSPGGTNANVYWCAGGNDQAKYDVANKAALALARTAGLKLADGVIVGRVLLIRLDPAKQGSKMPKLGEGDLISADMAAPVTVQMLDQLRTGAQMVPTSRGAAPGPNTIAIYACR
jgi:hypothetical protein